MAVVANVTVYDDETGEIFSENYIIKPNTVDIHCPHKDLNVCVSNYHFEFEFSKCDTGGRDA